ncbi:MAG: sugar-binding protein [Candidatus Brocadiia bacterium]
MEERLNRKVAWWSYTVLLVGVLALSATLARATEPFVPGWDGAPGPRTEREFRNDPADFQFAIVSDRTGGHRPGVFGEAIGKLELLQPEFVMSVGDLVEGYTDDEDELDRQWAEFIGLVDGLGIPFFFVPGNHDISQRRENPAVRTLMTEEWTERFGRRYYHFVYRDVLFLCLNTEEAGAPRLGDEQLAYFRDVVARHPGVRWTFVFMHRPLWKGDRTAVTGWDRLESMLKGRQYTVFAGHHHTYSREVRDGREHYMLATTGGASELAGPGAGRFDHVVWVTMTDDGPRLANLPLDGVLAAGVPGSAGPRGVAELARRMKSGSFFGVGALVADSVAFEGGTVRMGATNPADAPLQLTVQFHTHPLVKPAEEAVSMTISPGATVHREVDFSAVEPASPEGIPPVRATWRAVCRPSGLSPVEGSGTCFVPVRRDTAPLACARAARPVVVDGRLDEWEQLPHGEVPEQILPDPALWTEQDCSFRFQTAYDDDYVYVAVDVTDDTLLLDPSRDAWHQDMLGVILDARPDSERSWCRSERWFRDFQVCWLSPGATPEEVVWTQRKSVAPGTKAVCVKREGGYSAEVAFPAGYLRQAQGGPWEVFRLNVVVGDCDVDFGSALTLWWRPDWRSPQTYAGSGTFVRR